jgi:hypothetical protein
MFCTIYILVPKLPYLIHIDNELILFGEIIDVCYDNHTKQIRFVARMKNSCFNVKETGLYSNPCPLKN